MKKYLLPWLIATGFALSVLADERPNGYIQLGIGSDKVSVDAPGTPYRGKSGLSGSLDVSFVWKYWGWSVSSVFLASTTEKQPDGSKFKAFTPGYDSLQVSALGLLPLGKRTVLYGRAGTVYLRTASTITDSDSTEHRSDTTTSFLPVLGLGVRVNALFQKDVNGILQPVLYFGVEATNYGKAKLNIYNSSGSNSVTHSAIMFFIGIGG